MGGVVEQRRGPDNGGPGKVERYGRDRARTEKGDKLDTLTDLL